MSNIKFCFNAFELQYLIMVAERRNCGKQPNGVVDKKYDHQNDFSVNLHGVMGEFATAKYLGLKLDHSISLSGDDKIGDLMSNQTSIQVKTNMNRWKQVYLYFNSFDLFKANVAVLAVIESATEVGLLGWITPEEFEKRATIKNFNYGDRACVLQDYLFPMGKLKKLLDK